MWPEGRQRVSRVRRHPRRKVPKHRVVRIFRKPNDHVGDRYKRNFIISL